MMSITFSPKDCLCCSQSASCATPILPLFACACVVALEMEMADLNERLMGEDEDFPQEPSSEYLTVGEDEKRPSKIEWLVGWKELRTWNLVQGCLAEFIATLLFIYVGAGAVVAQSQFVVNTTPDFSVIPGVNETAGYAPPAAPDALTVIALAHGFTIAVLVSAIAHLSGGHVNPAVSFSMIITGNVSIIRGVLYMVLQTLGSVLGAALLAACLPKSLHQDLGAHDLHPNISAFQGFFIEFILTFVLLFTIFGNAVDKRGSSVLAPFYIGLAVVIDHFVGIPLTGASMNPARSFGPAFITRTYNRHYIIYWFGPLSGGAAAALLYRLVFLRGQSKVVTIETVSDQIKELSHKQD
ncbi:hypothetical protein PTSG_07645 [Salpingoeca rosetta]|uniref:Aquaporin n=1 Tax=Salpingoeca rosetta (strain ATCC 50818 / BSB-021) TaxID=946362 RepID=F2UHC9_SALR5|nr:uncharacterized protein PTSG_07645 [Salpingoeca rosetta]EGD76528.1 hypothetical protein PTSG_07645 [Salpingoeca rosetta]|eukprot:XP_004991442.1 hypothetical protein PTSG_07645 [Salpingoeca rosetta]